MAGFSPSPNFLLLFVIAYCNKVYEVAISIYTNENQITCKSMQSTDLVAPSRAESSSGLINFQHASAGMNEHGEDVGSSASFGDRNFLDSGYSVCRCTFIQQLLAKT